VQGTQQSIIQAIESLSDVQVSKDHWQANSKVIFCYVTNWN